MAATSLTTFSNVDVSKIDLEEDPPPEQSAHGTAQRLNGDQHGMGDLTGGMGDLDDMDNELFRTHQMEVEDVGKTFDVNKDGSVTKTLIQAGFDERFDHPQAGWLVDIQYTARVAGSAEPFETVSEPSRFTVGNNELPPGVEMGLKTMRTGEVCTLTLQPSQGFGDMAADMPGGHVPGGSVLEYEVTLVKIMQVEKLEDGQIRKTTLTKGVGWEKPLTNAEVTVKWSAKTKEPPEAAPFLKESEFSFIAGDASIPAFWNSAVVGHMGRGEICELEVAAALGFGAEGAPELGVPPNADLIIGVEVLSWVPVDDVSKEKDGSAMKRVLQMGEGWERPRPHYVCTIDVEVRPSADAPVAARAEAIQVTVGEIGSSSAPVSALQDALGEGAADLAKVLETLLPLMQLHEVAELRCTPAVAGGTAPLLCVKVALPSWIKVEEVPSTGGMVLRTVLREHANKAKDYMRPNEDATCRVRYTVRRRTAASRPFSEGITEDAEVFETVSEAAAITFIVSDGPSAGVPPCVDQAVKEMHRTEVCLLSSTAEMGYGSPDYVRASGTPALPEDALSSPLEVEVELLDFSRAPELWQMGGEEKLRSQARLKLKGNKLFAKGELRAALRRYEEANKSAPKRQDFEPVPKEELSEDEDEDDAEEHPQLPPPPGSPPLPPTRMQQVKLPDAEVDAKLASSKAVTLTSTLNIAACHLRLGDCDKAVQSCTDALALEEGNVKALFRRAQAYAALHDFAGAKADLLHAARRDPQNRDVRKEFEVVKAAASEQSKKDKAVAAKMLG